MKMQTVAFVLIFYIHSFDENLIIFTAFAWNFKILLRLSLSRGNAEHDINMHTFILIMKLATKRYMCGWETLKVEYQV